MSSTNPSNKPSSSLLPYLSIPSLYLLRPIPWVVARHDEVHLLPRSVRCCSPCTERRHWAANARPIRDPRNKPNRANPTPQLLNRLRRSSSRHRLPILPKRSLHLRRLLHGPDPLQRAVRPSVPRGLQPALPELFRAGPCECSGRYGADRRGACHARWGWAVPLYGGLEPDC